MTIFTGSATALPDFLLLGGRASPHREQTFSGFVAVNAGSNGALVRGLDGVRGQVYGPSPGSSFLSFWNVVEGGRGQKRVFATVLWKLSCCPPPGRASPHREQPFSGFVAVNAGSNSALVRGLDGVRGQVYGPSPGLFRFWTHIHYPFLR
ncbi:hypothetical protein NDU88_001279 [Pleurodeles waltl]|uniref:Uncharacterized protein n=1 Tax=Pleurodeles waltl TaxID=8319 RepID=A0AAV7Q9C0_PLEWA|nr:hypothetical protein NDU88_001279 [Pleurodeles waltl]